MPTGRADGGSSGSERGRRVCLLTGAGGTLGDAFCRRYAAEYEILAVCRVRAPAVPSQYESFVDPLAPDSPVPENEARVYVVHADLEEPDELERVVELAIARYGRVDLLVNNAGYSRWHPHGLVDGDAALDDLQRHFTMNVGVPLRLATRLAQHLWVHRPLENRSANRNVVNISSLAGSKLFPNQGQGVYAASKAALNHLTRHMAAEFAAFGVRVNALAPNSFPSIVATDAVARAIARLDGETVTGRILAVDAAANTAAEPAASPQAASA